MKAKTSPPTVAWQTGDYQPHCQLELNLPNQFLLLCKLTDITPKQVISDFLHTLDQGSWQRQGRDKARALLVDYFVASGYGKQYYAEPEIRSLFGQLDAIGLLFPRESDEELLELHVRWRQKYQDYLFNRWWRSARRKM